MPQQSISQFLTPGNFTPLNQVNNQFYQPRPNQFLSPNPAAGFLGGQPTHIVQTDPNHALRKYDKIIFDRGIRGRNFEEFNKRKAGPTTRNIFFPQSGIDAGTLTQLRLIAHGNKAGKPPRKWLQGLSNEQLLQKINKAEEIKRIKDSKKGGGFFDFLKSFVKSGIGPAAVLTGLAAIPAAAGAAGGAGVAGGAGAGIGTGGAFAGPTAVTAQTGGLGSAVLGGSGFGAGLAGGGISAALPNSLQGIINNVTGGLFSPSGGGTNLANLFTTENTIANSLLKAGVKNIPDLVNNFLSRGAADRNRDLLEARAGNLNPQGLLDLFESSQAVEDYQRILNDPETFEFWDAINRTVARKSAAQGHLSPGTGEISGYQSDLFANALLQNQANLISALPFGPTASAITAGSQNELETLSGLFNLNNQDAAFNPLSQIAQFGSDFLTEKFLV